VNELVHLSDDVRDALDEGRPVVALETTIVAHGFPAPHGVEVGLAMEDAVREAGATPATIGVLDGGIRVGLRRDELARFDSDARKLGPRDLAACAVAGDLGATTVGGVLTVARAVGIRFTGTGGIGGVHRGYPSPPDVSADLVALVVAPVLVACSGAKSLLDIPATVEQLETLGIPVLGYRTDTLPLFYEAQGGPPVSQRVDDPATAARIAAAHWQLGACGLLLTNPPPQSIAVADLIEEAVAAAEEREDISGQAVTPFVLAYLHEHSGGRTREVNRALAVANARLAGEVAVAFAAL
jgi:pseudouridine-5'-phosphate glycosidase